MVEGLLVHLAEVLSAVPVVSVWPCSLGSNRSTLAKGIHPGIVCGSGQESVLG